MRFQTIVLLMIVLFYGGVGLLLVGQFLVEAIRQVMTRDDKTQRPSARRSPQDQAWATHPRADEGHSIETRAGPAQQR